MPEARSVVVRLTAETAQYIAAMQAAGTMTEGAMVKAEAATMSQSKALDTLGTKAGRIGAAAALGLAAMGAAAVQWESQWAGVSKTVDGTASEMAQLENELRGLARSMPATHKEIAATAEAAGQLGVAREDVTDFTKTMLMLGETTTITADQAATSIAQMANVMQTAPEDIDNLASALVALGNNGASTEAQILDMASRIAGAGAQIGLTEADILGIANAAASMGIEAEAGGSALSTVFTKLAKATAQGGADLEAFAKVAGVSAQEFKESFENDPARAFASFTAGLDKINKSGGDVFTTLDQLGMSDVRVSRALLAMASSGDYLTDSLDMGAQAFEENTALAQEYAKRAETTAAQVQVAWNQIKDAGIEAGAALLPVIADVANVTGDLANAFGKLPDPVHDATTELLGVTAVLGGGLWFGSKVIGGIASTKESLAALGIEAGTTSKALASIGKGLEFAALGIAITTITKQIEDLGNVNLEGDLTRNLEALANGNTVGNLQNMGKYIDEINSSFAHGQQNAFGWIPFADTTWKTAEKNINQVDEALAQMVEGGQADMAAKVMQQITDMAADQGISLQETTKWFDQYNLALSNLENVQIGEVLRNIAEEYGASAAATEKVIGPTTDLADALRDEAKATREAIAAMREKTAATNSAFDAETAWGQAVIAAREAAGKGKRGINELTAAGQENREVLSQLAAAWNNQSGAVQNTEGKFKNARQTFIDTAVAMGVPQAAAKKLANTMLEIPSQKLIEVRAKTEDAQAELERIQNFKLLDKYVTVHTLHDSGDGVDFQHGGLAAGGAITSHGAPAGLPTYLQESAA